MLLDAHVRPREQRSGERDECGERDQEYVERIDEELLLERRHRSVGDDSGGEQRRGGEGHEAHERIQLRRPALVAREREQQAAEKRDAEDEGDFHAQSSFSFSICRMSRLSNCSRIWKKKMPKMKVPTSTSSATPSSTTSGMP